MGRRRVQFLASLAQAGGALGKITPTRARTQFRVIYDEKGEKITVRTSRGSICTEPAGERKLDIWRRWIDNS